MCALCERSGRARQLLGEDSYNTTAEVKAVCKIMQSGHPMAGNIGQGEVSMDLPKHRKRLHGLHTACHGTWSRGDGNYRKPKQLNEDQGLNGRQAIKPLAPSSRTASQRTASGWIHVGTVSSKGSEAAGGSSTVDAYMMSLARISRHPVPHDFSQTPPRSCSTALSKVPTGPCRRRNLVGGMILKHLYQQLH